MTQSIYSLLANVAAARGEQVRLSASFAKRFAPEFNSVALLAPGETRLSELFRWLLDELASHGQGALFRDKFLSNVVKEDCASWKGARSLCEVATQDGLGRIDLLIESADGQQCIIVENKPWAGWQARQLARYRDDQRRRRARVRVHAFIGHPYPGNVLDSHWTSGSDQPLPSDVTASSFQEVSAWLEECAQSVDADRKRYFVFDLAQYCRASIMGDATLPELNETAQAILSGGADWLKAAHDIAAAAPFAMSQDVAKRVGGHVTVSGPNPIIHVPIGEVDLQFVVFGRANPWVGVSDPAQVDRLKGACKWGTPENAWPRWIRIAALGEDGRGLLQAALDGDTEKVAGRIPTIAQKVIGTTPHEC